jgi:hypothetical protein
MARKPMTKARAKRLIGIGTAVAPMLAPYALAVAGAVRGTWDNYRAERLGVTTDKLAEFTGPGGGLHARISHIVEALTDLESRGTPAAQAFAKEATPRITELATAVRAAEQMPANRRRTAFKAISGELDGIERGVLMHLGITT